MNDAPPPTHWTVDALEDTPHGPVARLERPDGQTADVPLDLLPGGTREGDVLAVDRRPGTVTLSLQPAETQARRAARQAELDALNARGEAAAPAGGLNL